MKIVVAVIATLVVAAIIMVVTIYSGVYDVAATVPPNPVVRWALRTTMENSVRNHAQGITVPQLSDAALVEEGFGHYRENCAQCHGAPGVEPSELKEGLEPPPPSLKEAVQNWRPAELFWIIKNGVRMTAMPAWGPSHSDDELWAIVAFVMKLPSVSPEEYRAMDQRSHGHHHHEGGAGSDHDHAHSD